MNWIGLGFFFLRPLGYHHCCWEWLGTGGEGDDRGWDGWMASLTLWTWVWVNSGSWWWTGRPGMLRFTGSQRVGHNWGTELSWTEDTIVIIKDVPNHNLNRKNLVLILSLILLLVYLIPSLCSFSEFLFCFRSSRAIGEAFERFFFPNSSWGLKKKNCNKNLLRDFPGSPVGKKDSVQTGGLS